MGDSSRIAGLPEPAAVLSESLTKGTIVASASGDTVVYTPAAGKSIRLYFFGYSADAGVTGVLVGLKLAGYAAGAVFDAQYLITSGQAYARNIQGGKRYIQGSVNGALTVNLGAAQTVHVNYELDEV